MAISIETITTGNPLYQTEKALRLEVLLQPIGLDSSYIQPEKELQDFHVIAMDGSNMLGCCVLSPRENAAIQLRQMAVQSSAQKTGIGKSIVAFAEDFARSKGFSLLYLHARDVVISFYTKCGYTLIEPGFEEVGIPHHRMEKNLA